jgi:hypothetical protein
MFDPVRYPYSLKFSVAAVILMVVFMLILLNNVLAANTLLTWIVFGVFAVIFLFFGAVMIGRRLIPAIKGDIAFELDDEGINDYIRDASICWSDIKEINLVRGRTAASLLIELKWESDYGSRLSIPLRWIKGRDSEIYETTMAFFEEAIAEGNS